MESLSPATFIQRLQRDDRDAINDAFSQYYDSLCRFASSYVSLPDAEELVSDVFINIWKSRKTLSIQTTLKTYLYSSVRYACYRSISARKLPALNIHELEDVMDVASSHGPEESLIFQETQSLVSSIVQRLPSRCRQIFIMNRFDGLTYREIAEVLSISEKTVENQIVKALQVMRADLFRFEKA